MLGAPDGKTYLALYKSTDGGETWTAERVPDATLTKPGLSLTIDGIKSSNYGQSLYDQVLLAGPKAGALFFGGVWGHDQLSSRIQEA